MSQQNQIPEPAATPHETPDAQPAKQPAIRWLTYLLLLPLIALATAVFGCISLICGLWDRPAASSTSSPASGPVPCS